MATTNTTFDRRCSRQVGRRRIVEIRNRLRRVCDMDDLADIVPDRKALSRILCKMRNRRQVYELQIQMGDFIGEPRRVYCIRKMYAPGHDNMATKVMKALGWPEAEDPANIEPVGGGENWVKPDEVTILPKPRFWEFDRATEHYEEIAKKVAAFKLQDRAVLWVCPTEARRQKLLSWTKDIHDRTFIALYGELIAKPMGEVWMAASGRKVALSFEQKDV